MQRLNVCNSFVNKISWEARHLGDITICIFVLIVGYLELSSGYKSTDRESEQSE